MTVATVQAALAVNANVVQLVNVDVSSPQSTAGIVNATNVTAREIGSEGVHTTILTLSAMPITVRDAQQGNGVKIYTFPQGKIFRLGADSSMAITTTSDPTTTLNGGVTCNCGVGSTTQANATLATTEQDFVQVGNITASAAQNTAGAVATNYGITNVTLLDGSSTAIAAFLNLAVAGATDIDLDATVTVSGTITLHWLKV